MFHRNVLDRESVLSIGSRRLGHIFLFSVLLLLLLVALPRAQAQGDRCWIYNASATFVLPSSGYLSGTVPLFLNNNCSTSAQGTYGAGEDGVVISGDRQSAISKCNRGNGSKNTVKPIGGGAMWSCQPLKGSKGGNGGWSSSWVEPEVTPTPLSMGGVRVEAARGENSGIQFQRFDHYAVGIQSVVDMGILDVVDVWGNAKQNYEVCFPQSGEIVFLDAATSPRTVVAISQVIHDGYTCGAMNRPGTMVLVKGSTQSASDAALVQRFIDSTKDPVSSAIGLENCTVTSSHNLNLREEPWGEKLDIVPKASTLTATARTQSWFKVSYTSAEVEESEGEGTQAVEIEGWIAAWLSRG